MSIHRISLQCLARLTGSPSSTACKSAECCNSLSRFRRSKRDSQRPIVRWPGLTCVLVLLCTYPALADNPPIKENLATAGDAALQSNDNNLAIDKYTAIIQPSDETIYNLGIAHYRNGDLQQAAEQFRMVIGSQNDSLAARARFNLGNAFYSQALTQLKPPAADNAAPTSAQATTATTPTASQDVESGVKLLRSAITQYRSALRIDANDTDARANIELAQSLIDEIEQQQDQQQQDQQQQDQQQQDQQQQDQQQQDQQQQDQQQQDQQQQD
ncbi:MAG: tetratricopeptide repeat protein, partial [Rubripirellula sp.]